MARARNIKPGFCKNEDLAECTVTARLCFALLPMLADRDGRLEDRPKRIKGELFPFDSIEVEPLLAELEQHDLIARYIFNGLGLIQILGFRKHQNPHHREPASTLPPHPSLRLDADGKYIHAVPMAGSHGPEASDSNGSHGVEASGKPGADPPAQPPEASGEPRASPRPASDKPGSAVLIPDSGFLIPDSSSLRSEATSGEVACRQGVDPPLLALVEGPRKSKPGGVPDCPHQAILALWAEVLPAMPQHEVDQWRGARADHLRARWRETAAAKRWQGVDDGMTYFRRLFAYVAQSRFLTGRVTPRDPGKTPFTVTLAWLVRPENWAKTIEGTYHEEAVA